MMYQRIDLQEVDSTNSFLRRTMLDASQRITLVTAHSQTAGRGQRGNSWESEPGQNLVFSILIRPREFAVARMFCISEVIALSVCRALDECLPSGAEPFCVKWPNDIYHGDRKVAGILIETVLKGKCIENAIIGVGINVNQTLFRSDAPNPVSLSQITGGRHDAEALLQRLMGHFDALLSAMERGDFDALHEAYMQRLYRGDGFHAYRDEAGVFQARIAAVEPSGHLLLQDEGGRLRRYAFKEVAFCLDSIGGCRFNASAIVTE